MKSLLFLCHRLPYPPDKGDKIRAYHVLKALVSRFRVHVGTFVDTDEDWRHVPALRAMVASLEVRPLRRAWATVRSATGLLTGKPLTLPYYSDAGLQRWLRTTIKREDVAVAYLYSSAMGQYLLRGTVPLSIMDLCDLDSAKWLQYSRSRPFPAAQVYRREARLLAAYECELVAAHTWTTMVSEAETAELRQLVPGLANRVATIRNGVDTAYFDPAVVPADAPGAGPSVVFTGAMNYRANVDAVSWFVDRVWPSIRNSFPTAQFHIVGSRPTAAVQELTRHAGVIVTGTVPDVRPYVARAAVVVAPLRIARGLQNKVLEALAMARPVVATAAALAGLTDVPPDAVAVANEPQEFIAALGPRLAVGPGKWMNTVGRQYVVDRYGWQAALQPLLQKLGET